MARNAARTATSARGEQPAGVSFQADARENTTAGPRSQGDLGELAQNGREALRVAIDRYQGQDLIDLRITAPLTESSGLHVPTERGVSIRISLLPPLLEALQAAEVEARARGLL
jgi:hypothetical protein